MNPYLDTMPAAVENEQTQTVEVLDASNGTQSVISATTTTVLVDQHGARHFAQRQIRVRGNDGRIINPAEPVYRCACCNLDLLSQHTVKFCEFCQTTLHVAHTRTWDDGQARALVCPSCYERDRRARAIRRFLRWLGKI